MKINIKKLEKQYKGIPSIYNDGAYIGNRRENTILLGYLRLDKNYLDWEVDYEKYNKTAMLYNNKFVLVEDIHGALIEFIFDDYNEIDESIFD